MSQSSANQFQCKEILKFGTQAFSGNKSTTSCIQIYFVTFCLKIKLQFVRRMFFEFETLKFLAQKELFFNTLLI